VKIKKNKYQHLRLIALASALLVILVFGVWKLTNINRSLSDKNFLVRLFEQPTMDVQVGIKESGVTPSEVVINQNDEVTFKNEGQIDQEVSGQDWCSGNISPGECFSKKFDQVGNFEFSVLDSESKGKIIVK
jgi:plastocyanin